MYRSTQTESFPNPLASCGFESSRIAKLLLCPAPSRLLEKTCAVMRAHQNAGA
jgi:hypothetical protein